MARRGWYEDRLSHHPQSSCLRVRSESEPAGPVILTAARAPLRGLSPATWGILAFCLVAGFSLFFAIRAAQPIEGLGNHDIAGIAYEADLLLRGQLPYRDSIELKTPGPFFLVAAAWALAGRSATTLNTACVLWVLLGTLAIFVAAFATYGRKGTGLASGWDADVGVRCGAVASALYLASSAQFESNYSTWMMPPYAAAYAALIVALRCDRFSGHVWTGVFATLAYLCKNHGFVIGAVAVIVWGWARLRGEPGARWSAFGGWIVGAVLGALPIIVFYASHGALVELVQGVFPLDKVAAYSNSRSAIEVTWPAIVRGATFRVYELFPKEVLWAAGATMVAGVVAIWTRLSIATVGQGSRPDSRFDWLRARMISIEPVLPGLVFVLLSVVAGGLGGMRFFRHYNAQYLPALAILAAHPEPWRRLAAIAARLTRADGETRSIKMSRAAAWLLGVVASIFIMAGGLMGAQRHYLVLTGNVSIAFDTDAAPRQVGAFISERSTANDTIHCWGWKSWSVYFWANRHAPGRLYKELGAVTEYNRNGMFDIPRAVRNTRLEWKPGPAADELLEVYRTRPPAFLVRARPFFPAVTNDPLDESGELAALIGREYELVKRIGSIDIFGRRALRDNNEQNPTRTIE